MGLIIGALIVLGVVVVAGGGNTISGFGQDTRNVSHSIDRSVEQ